MNTKEVIHRGANAAIVAMLALECWGNQNANFAEIYPPLLMHFGEAFLPHDDLQTYLLGFNSYNVLQSLAIISNTVEQSSPLSSLSFFSNFGRLVTSSFNIYSHLDETASQDSFDSTLRPS